MTCRVLAAVVVALLLMGTSLMGVPGSLAAMEKEASAAAGAGEWLSGLWSDFAGWLGLAADNDGSCSLDPDGCPGAAAPSPPASDEDGRCSVDPDGCPGG